eukprot:TRINITY_DN16787_c0_g1_i1.p1 TRINITY_DN16787_c0_g1~~TRINITY_DN16787_c0_g1_i1.p1  ORF type:complete len:235 (+),score=20.43 TRINITY_DN16787_c0_g1_i1:152-856(+)
MAPVRFSSIPSPNEAEKSRGMKGLVCPVGYGRKDENDALRKEDPVDDDDFDDDESTGPKDPFNQVPDYGAVPAAGRGNSETGEEWVGPSPKQLQRSLARKKKGGNLDGDDLRMMSIIHGIVTEETWTAIMEYERLHANECPFPKLARFEGKQEFPTVKARFLNLFGVPIPFDRHDWYVDRCGQEVRYVIDYHNVPTGVHVDARPVNFPGGIFDRARVQLNRILRGGPPSSKGHS